MAADPTSNATTIIADWQDVRPPLLKYREESIRRLSRVFERPLPLCRDKTYTFATISWRILFGTVGFLDFLATLVVERRTEDDSEFCLSKGHHFFSFGASSSCKVEHQVSRAQQLSSSLLNLLKKWAGPIGVCFSMLWFLDAFLKAQWRRDEKVRELDKKRLLHGNRKSQVGGAWGTYYRTIVINLLFLPVGFFVFVGNLPSLLRYSDINSGERENDEEHSFYTIYATHCLLVAIFQFSIHVVHDAVGKELLSQRKKIQWRLVRSAIRRPIKSYSRVRIVLRTLRLFKYIAPLMGLTVKGLENMVNLSKSIRQHWTVYRAYRRRKKKWRTMQPEEKRLAASVRIESAFRGMQTRKGVRSFMSTLKARKSTIAARMQKVARQSLVRGRTQLDLKKLELEQLKKEALTFQKNGITMGANNRRRMYQLEEEIQETASELFNKRLLLRPNARFAVVWKIIFVLCVILDIMQQAVQLNMVDKLAENTGAPDVGDLFESILPISATEWDECLPPPFVHNSSGCFSRLFRNPNIGKVPLPPWYCSEWIVAVQDTIVRALRLFSTKLVLLLAIVCYLDVIITFFIGELHIESGVLMPKSFFKRWIFPGLLLELLANPQMETTSLLLGQLKKNMLHIGPLRVWRWTVTCFYPAFKLVAKQAEVRFWRPAIAQQNQEAFDNKHRDDMGSRLMAMSSNMLMSQSNILGNAHKRSIYYDRD